MSPLVHSVAPAGPDDYPEISRLWEASVRATHHFLAEPDLAFHARRMIPEYLPAVRLWAARDPQDRMAGFLGIADHRIEMLFVHPDELGRGVGRMLVAHALAHEDATEVDVNEQNAQAVGFYKRMGFCVESRSPRDAAGHPYPLLRMRWREPATVL